MIGNTAAPNLNALVNRFGLATQYFGVAHPSEPNYVALMGGNTFGIANDDPYYINKVAKPSLGSQLDKAGISWKAYLQGLPHPAYKSICYPAKCNGAPDQDPTTSGRWATSCPTRPRATRTPPFRWQTTSTARRGP